MKKDSLWPKLGITWNNGHTGAAWTWIFWWCRNYKLPSSWEGHPHSNMTELQHKKFFLTRHHSVKAELITEAYILPW